MQWNRLRLDPQQENLPLNLRVSHTKYRFVCSCGGTKEISWASVLRGLSKSCGCLVKESRQNRIPSMVGRKFGRLLVITLDHQRNEGSYNGQSFWQCSCECGGMALVSTAHLNSGHTSSCGCYMREQATLANFKDIEGQRFGALTTTTVHGVGQGGKYQWNVTCDCGNTSVVYGDSLVQGLIKSCGCHRMGMMANSPATHIADFIRNEYHVPVEMEVPLSSLVPQFSRRHTVDIYVPSASLAIEYHGLIWHSERYLQGSKDADKFQWLQQGATRLLQIYQDEWNEKPDVVKALVRSMIQPRSGKRIKPVFAIHHETPFEARTFLDAYHYLGAASGGLTVTAHHGTQLVGVWVFMKREEGVILWHRASWNHEYKAWNPHEKALHLALPELRSMGFKRMVTFSDNRFHTGGLYGKLGFTFEEELKPDYSYTNGSVRKSKYALRVKAGMDEKSEAEAKGWYRIWDSGKKRFSLNIN